MKQLFLSIGLIGLFALSAFAQNPAPTPAPKPAATPSPLALKVGDMAPDFTLPDTTGKKVTLSDFRGKNNVVLAFFVLAFTGG